MWCISLTALGDPIGLVIIDMQPHFAERNNLHKMPPNAEKGRQVLARQVELIKVAKEAKAHIILVEFHNRGPSSPVLQNAIGAYSRTATFVKHDDDVFSPYSLVANDVKRYLDSNGIKDLVMAGANGNACVKCSIESALHLGYRVWAASDAIIDFNFTDFILPYHYDAGDIRLSSWAMVLRRQRIFHQILGDDVLSVIRSNSERCSALESVLSLLPFKHLFSGWNLIKPPASDKPPPLHE